MSDGNQAVSQAGPTKMSRNAITALTVLVITAFVMMINETSVSVALPSIMEEFSITAATAQWLLTGVLLTMAIIMPATGWMLDRFSTRSIYLFAVGIFLVGTVLAAMSPVFGVMLLGRILQAVGTAVIMPLQMTVTMTVVPPHRRGTVMGIISVVLAVGPALGPTYSGLVMSLGSWHMVFWALVPFVAIAGIIGALKLPNITEVKKTSLDVLSLFLSALAFGGLVYGVSSLGVIISGGETAGIAIAFAVVGVISLIAFISRQLSLGKHGKALLDLQPLKIRNFSIAVATMFIIQMMLLGVSNLLPLYLQGALLATALVAGMVNLPGGLVETMVSPIAGALFDRVGPRPLAIPGVIIMAASIWWLSTVSETSPIWLVVVMFVALSVGISMTFTPLMTTALSSLPSDLYSHGSAISNTILQVAGATGTAVMMAIFSYVSENGGNTPEATASGASMSFLLAAILSTIAVVLVLFIKRPANQTETKISEEAQHVLS